MSRDVRNIETKGARATSRIRGGRLGFAAKKPLGQWGKPKPGAKPARSPWSKP